MMICDKNKTCLLFRIFLHHSAFCVRRTKRVCRSPTIAPRGSTRCLSNLFPFGLPTRAFNFRGRNVIAFYSFQTGETQSEDKEEGRARMREPATGAMVGEVDACGRGGCFSPRVPRNLGLFPLPHTLSLFLSAGALYPAVISS